MKELDVEVFVFSNGLLKGGILVKCAGEWDCVRNFLLAKIVNGLHIANRASFYSLDNLRRKLRVRKMQFVRMYRHGYGCLISVMLSSRHPLLF